MKNIFALVLVSGFFSAFAFADECKIGQAPWTKTVTAVGTDHCDDFNFNGTSCFDSPSKDEAIAMGKDLLDSKLLHCKQVCDYDGGKFEAAQPAAPECKYVQGISKVDDAYECSISASISCLE